MEIPERCVGCPKLMKLEDQISTKIQAMADVLNDPISGFDAITAENNMRVVQDLFMYMLLNDKESFNNKLGAYEEASENDKSQIIDELTDLANEMLPRPERSLEDLPEFSVLDYFEVVSEATRQEFTESALTKKIVQNYFADMYHDRRSVIRLINSTTKLARIYKKDIEVAESKGNRLIADCETGTEIRKSFVRLGTPVVRCGSKAK